ncbi:helix-turn-helix domain-containing protein [Streptomyces sp. NPDC056835]|uniref:helix-turn-helix domain-containing protein n=1 Tax=Streptomyces sp. NPDC056835 TaxID=3345956 RepID=UPI0036879D6A
MKTLQQPAFGQRLKALRTARGQSQRALAADGMSTGYLSRLESGTRPPTRQAVAYLAERLGVSPAEFEEPAVPSLAQAVAQAASGEVRDAVPVLERLVVADGDEDPALRWQARWILAEAKQQLGEHEAESVFLQEITELGDRLRSPELQVRARTRFARCKRTLGDMEQACVLAAEAYGIAKAGGLPVADTAAALLVLVSAEAETGHLSDARVHADELGALVDNARGTLPVQALWTAATVRVRQGDYNAAQQLLGEALRRLDSHDDLQSWMRLRLAAASLNLQLVPPQTEAAVAWLEEAEQAVALVGTAQHHCEFLVLRAHLAFHQGRAEEARALCDEAVDTGVRLSFRDQTRLEVLQHRLLIQEGRYEEGTSGLRTLAQTAHEGANMDLAAEIWRVLADYLAHPPGR